MLNLAELQKILKDNQINHSDYSPKTICEIYGKKIDNELILPLIEEMVLATMDFDTPLYDVLAYANDFEEKLNIPEDDTLVCDVLNIVLTNMPICEQNANRLLNLIEDADVLDAYNILLEDYKQYLTQSQVEMLKSLAKQAFGEDVVL